MDDQGGVVSFLTSGISEEARSVIGEPPTGKGLLGALHAESKPIRIPEIAKDSCSVGFPSNHPPVDSMLGVPITGENGVLGNLYLTNKRGGAEFTEHDQSIVEAFASYAAIAIEKFIPKPFDMRLLVDTVSEVLAVP